VYSCISIKPKPNNDCLPGINAHCDPRPKTKGNPKKCLKKSIHEKLSQIEQDPKDRSFLLSIKDQLISHKLLLHKDRGVKILTACCLADIFRIYAPDAPFSDTELWDIFDFFQFQFKEIPNETHAYYSSYFYLLESLATVKVLVLIVDLNYEDLIVDILKTFNDHFWYILI
jgi:sister-chromatid-cohesion protein PDS5